MSWFLYCLNNIHACLFVYPLLFSSWFCWLPKRIRKCFLPYKTDKDLFVCLFYCTFVSVLNVWSELNWCSEDCSSTGSYWFMVYHVHEYLVWGAAVGSSHRSACKPLNKAVMERGSCPSRLLCFLLVYPLFVFKHLYDATAAAVYRSGLSENLSLQADM